MIVMAIFGVFYLIIYVIAGLTGKYNSRGHRRGLPRMGFGGKTGGKKGGHCDGDCANCPAHYGYRYGRWYYGHGHQWGCSRGGNGGRTGRTLRD